MVGASGAAMGVLAACAPAPAPAAPAAQPQAPATSEPQIVKETVEVQVTQVVEKIVTPTPVAYKKGGSLVMAMSGDTKTLDPQVSQLWVWTNIRNQIFDRLLQTDANGDIQPMLATEYKWVDPQTLELTLRDDVSFHNGEKFTADDVKHTLERIMQPDLPTELRARIATLDKIEIPNPTTVRLLLKEPNSTFPSALATIDVVSKSVPEDQIATTPVGTGPFKFVEWRPNESLKLTRNETYYLPDQPYLDEIIYKPITDSEARIASLLSGDVDVNFEVALKDVPRLATTDGVKTTLVDVGGIWMFYLNLRDKPFNDKKVRQALLYGFDRAGYSRDFLLGLSKPSNTPIPPGHWAHNAEAEAMYPYDPEKAKSLLAEAGYSESNPLEIEIIYPVGLEEYKTATEYFQSTMELIGVKVKVTAMELAAWSNKIIKEKTFQIALDGRGSAGRGDPAGPYDDATFFKPGADNFDGFTEDMIPGYLDLIKQGKSETDKAKRTEIYKQLQAKWAEELPGWILTLNPTVLVTRNWVKGYEPLPQPPQLKTVWLDK
jgi:peptide/nickel transport system substrate-binding protein